MKPGRVGAMKLLSQRQLVAVAATQLVALAFKTGGGWDARAADGDSLVAVFDGLVAVFGVVVLRSWKRSSSSVYTYE